MEVNGMILKLKDVNFFINPGNSVEKASLDFQSHCNAKAGDLQGRIDIRATFVIPDDKPIEISLQSESFCKLIEGLEFIRCGEEYPVNESFHCITRRKVKEKE